MVRDSLGGSRTVKDGQGQSGMVRDSQGRSWTVKDVRGHSGMFVAVRDNMGQTGTIRAVWVSRPRSGRWGQSGAIESHLGIKKNGKKWESLFYIRFLKAMVQKGLPIMMNSVIQ